MAPAAPSRAPARCSRAPPFSFFADDVRLGSYLFAILGTTGDDSMSTFATSRANLGIGAYPS